MTEEPKDNQEFMDAYRYIEARAKETLEEIFTLETRLKKLQKIRAVMEYKKEHEGYSDIFG